MSARLVSLFLCGDVMPARGIDQLLPYPSEPSLHESCVRDARDYVHLAERIHGLLPRSVPFHYPWGVALHELNCRHNDARIINLETAITTTMTWDGTKGIHYKMHPRNVPFLKEAKIDCCVVANNHVLDWGEPGLLETLATLQNNNIALAGAGLNANEARAPAILPISEDTRVLIFAYGCDSSGVPPSWAATEHRPGVNFLSKIDTQTAQHISQHIQHYKRKGDIVIVSIHWGSNWGYSLPEKHREFAHELIASSQVDLIHGHSSHHPLGIEVFNSKLILYGCGDLINDYEGIESHLGFRGDLALMYFPFLDSLTGELKQLNVVPLRMKRFQLDYADKSEALWLADMLSREGMTMGTSISCNPDNSLELLWKRKTPQEGEKDT